jgi:hypothetical protein
LPGAGKFRRPFRTRSRDDKKQHDTQKACTTRYRSFIVSSLFCQSRRASLLGRACNPCRPAWTGLLNSHLRRLAAIRQVRAAVRLLLPSGHGRPSTTLPTSRPASYTLVPAPIMAQIDPRQAIGVNECNRRSAIWTCKSFVPQRVAAPIGTS